MRYYVALINQFFVSLFVDIRAFIKDVLRKVYLIPKAKPLTEEQMKALKDIETRINYFLEVSK